MEKVKKEWNKIINYIKNNKLYIIVMIIGAMAFMLQMKYVELYADDFSIATAAKLTGFRGAIVHLFENYMTWGGGPTPSIAMTFILFPMSVWKVTNCAMIVIMIILAVKMITYNNKVNKAIIATILWCCVYILYISISREILYWFDGNLAYVWTAFQMFIYIYYLYSRIIMKTAHKKYDYAILNIFAFFAGWSGPQAGALTVIIPLILFAWSKFINKDKIKPIYIISWVIGTIGFLVYFLAPGNQARSLQVFPEFTNYNIIDKVLFRINTVWELMFSYEIYKFASIPFYLFLTMGFMSMVAMKKTLQKENDKIFDKIINIISKCVILFLILVITISNCAEMTNINSLVLKFEPLLEHINNNTFSIKMLIPYILTSLVLIAGVLISYYISYKEKTPLLFIMFVSALLGQGMMLVPPYSPLRTTCVTIILLWVAIAYLFKIIINENISVIGVFTLVLAITVDFNISIILLLAYFIFGNADRKENYANNKIEIILILLVMIALAGITYTKTLKGYKENSQIYNENITRIEEFKQNPTEDNILYLKEFSNPNYAFNGFVGIEWIENAVRDYFELDKNVILKYEQGG